MVSNYPSDTAYAWWLMEHFWATLGQRHITAGHQAYVAYPQITKSPEHLTALGIEAVELPFSWTTAKERGRVLDFIRENKIATVYLTDRSWFNGRYLFLRAHGVTRILVHDHTPGDRPPTRGVKGILKALRNRVRPLCADYMLCVSDLMRKRDIENARIPASRVITVQNGVSSLDDVSDNREVRRSLGIDDTTLVIISTGRAHPYKRFDFIIRVAAVVKQLAPGLDVCFLIAGGGPALEDLKQQVSASGLEQTVKLLGFHPNARQLLSSADIAFHAALGEGFSLSIVEYMSAGLPVLVPDIPSVSQAISHKVTGFIFPPASEIAAATLIIELGNNPAERKRMGAAARAVAKSEYNLHRCTKEFEAALDLALGNHHQQGRASRPALQHSLHSS